MSVCRVHNRQPTSLDFRLCQSCDSRLFKPGSCLKTALNFSWINIRLLRDRRQGFFTGMGYIPIIFQIMMKISAGALISMEVAGVPFRHSASCLQAAYTPFRRVHAPHPLRLLIESQAPGDRGSVPTPATSPLNAKTPPLGGVLINGGGGSRTRVLVRVPWASTGLDVHCIVGGRLAARRAASPYPGCSRLLTFRPESRPASIATGIRPLKAAQPVPAFYRLRGESVTVVVGS